MSRNSTSNQRLLNDFDISVHDDDESSTILEATKTNNTDTIELGISSRSAYSRTSRVLYIDPYEKWDRSFKLNNQIVLITGGSQGLGKSFATKYFKDAINTTVIISSRSEKKLTTASLDIASKARRSVDPSKINLAKMTNPIDLSIPSASNRLFYIPCDLSNYNNVQSMFDTLQLHNLLPTQVIACAGGSTPKLFKDLTPTELELGVKTNYLTVLYLAHTVARLLDHCHLILFASSTTFFPFIGYSQYAPMKVSVKALASILRQELPHFRISCVYPGNFKSEGFDNEELTKPSITKIIEGPSAPISSDECRDKILKWLKLGYDDITTDLIGWILMSLDLGLNKHSTSSPLWVLQFLFGVTANLIVVPIYMLFCNIQITKWFKKQHENRMDQLS
ncbi:hypothetical protein TBLA_0D05250 [Henningerozyma blattae CBS 6284]|uniref:3-ketodihydrosphingosine reductase TSC10 n=1 Tax=Henningerozyma blattae (strain ATCC 34711 / CBS 6284 / DSM 70876 / NBRC 10599 / NRRL Y-10934 / UCD 77-7) TaxID=1071380 RepID=I2H3R6_HENB6|nr:hypothetical protein TBLA_0D05250 [Tetrapisispora blattae CBS 6284]CCH61018.1 hypothetical protein TBLA_0D05250 [Tetrapisispora blattae CBS 6284]